MDNNKNKAALVKSGGKVKDNGYSSNHLHAKESRKASEASIRQVIYEAMSVKDRIKLAKSRRGESKKELVRLEKLNK